MISAVDPVPELVPAMTARITSVSVSVRTVAPTALAIIASFPNPARATIG